MPNPITEAQPSSLDELFSRDPLDMSDDDIQRIVDEERRARLKWMEDQLVKPAKKAPKEAAKPTLRLEDILGDD